MLFSQTFVSSVFIDCQIGSSVFINHQVSCHSSWGHQETIIGEGNLRKILCDVMQCNFPFPKSGLSKSFPFENSYYSAVATYLFATLQKAKINEDV